MIEIFEDALASPGFYILSALAITATVIGWIMSRNFGASLPIWQLIVILIVEVLAAAFFAGRG